jgi:1,4-alpha-glucan branching enzyme
MSQKVLKQNLLTPDDQHFIGEGRFFAMHDKLGAHILPGGKGVHFAVVAPNAKSVSVIGDFNSWDRGAHFLQPVGSTGVWAGIVPEAQKGQCYKYHIVSHQNGYAVDKADPCAICSETPPRTGSVIWDLEYQWNDSDWMAQRADKQTLDKPMSIYEVHFASWRRVPEDGNRSLSYTEMADPLIEHVKATGFTHVEFMPIMEHPFGGSWGYQVTGYFAPTRRFGDPQGLMYLIDRLHQAGIGVILDWVPSHFPSDEHGLAYFDGTHLYEHADPRQGYHPDWKSYIFNFGRTEVQNFLISNALFWLEKYHVDGLRVDAVASMLYLDYSREAGEWIPNRYGGRENLEALHFLRTLNETVYARHPGIQMIAEESTAWPAVSRPLYTGGLGFGLKWDMGWMHDTLRYFAKDPVYRPYHQNDITFRSLYAFHENFVLSLSHDEVVHGKGSLINKMAGGDDWQKFANLRCLYTYMFATPGKKLLFMGAEFGQRSEWNHDSSLDWNVLDYDCHSSLQRAVSDLNRLYTSEPALQFDCTPDGFQWVDANDQAHCVISFLRKDPTSGESILAVFNLTPVPRYNYQVGVPQGGFWHEIFNSDAGIYGGSNVGNGGTVEAAPIPLHGQSALLTLTLPPLGGLLLKWKG